MEFHPIANIFPLLAEDKLQALADDIREHGLRERVVVFEGKILDGRNRYTACLLAGCEPDCRDFKGTAAEAIEFVWSTNVHRRHLQSGQAAACWKKREKVEGDLAETVEAIREEAKEEKKRKPKSVPQKIGEQKHDRETDAKRAKLAGTNRQYINDADRLDKEAPDLLDAVASGDKSMTQAKSELRSRQKMAERKEKAKVAEKIKAQQPEWEIKLGECVEQLTELQANTVRLVFADPPYNIGIDYGDGAKADKLPPERYLIWVTDWVEECSRILTADGSLWVMIGDEYAAEFCVRIKQTGLHLRNWIKWYESFGTNCSNKFNRCSRHILYFTKHGKKFCFNDEAVSRPSDRQAIYKDKRASHHGKIWDDVWLIPRLTGTSEERIEDFPTQLPLELVRAIVGCASDPGDLVVDPFNGSGTTGAAAIELGRRYIGIEKSEQWHKKATERLSCITPA